MDWKTLNPKIIQEFRNNGGKSFTADVLELPEDERQQRVNTQYQRTPQFADYVESAAPRQIPAFKIQRL